MFTKIKTEIQEAKKINMYFIKCFAFLIAFVSILNMVSDPNAKIGSMNKKDNNQISVVENQETQAETQEVLTVKECKDTFNDDKELLKKCLRNIIEK